MGTSAGYKMPTGGNWTPLKHQATSFVQSGGSAPPGPVVSSYLHACGGATAISSRGDSGTGSRGGRSGGAGGSTRAARQTAQALGGFLGNVAAEGLDAALRGLGLESLIGKTSSEISAHLLDALCEPGATLDQAAARQALNDLISEKLGDAESYEDVEKLLTEGVDASGVHEMLGEFFGKYIQELFARDFYEDWAAKVGHDNAENALNSVNNCIDAAVHSKLVGRDLRTMDWRGVAGQQLASSVMKDVLQIFEVL